MNEFEQRVMLALESIARSLQQALPVLTNVDQVAPLADLGPPPPVIGLTPQTAPSFVITSDTGVKNLLP